MATTYEDSRHSLWGLGPLPDLPGTVLGIYYVPAPESSSTGELTFGGYDNSVITSSVTRLCFTHDDLPGIEVLGYRPIDLLRRYHYPVDDCWYRRHRHYPHSYCFG